MCNCRCGADCSCPRTLKLEVGKKYKARSGRIYEVYSYHQTKGLFICGNEGSQDSLTWRHPDGTTLYKSADRTNDMGDFVSEYKEPRTREITIYLQEHQNGAVSCNTVYSLSQKLIGKKTVTVTEGEGLENPVNIL